MTALRRAGRTGEAAGALTDRSALVRACARWAYAQGGGDAHARYLRLCADPASLGPGAVAGLAECGRREDAALLRPLLAHASAAVRARAVAGLRSLECAPPALVLPLLDDPSPAVVREATGPCCRTRPPCPPESWRGGSHRTGPRPSAGRRSGCCGPGAVSTSSGPRSRCWRTRTRACGATPSPRCSCGDGSTRCRNGTRRSANCSTRAPTCSATT
ncbi:hypothetical protein ACFQ60_12965 [Streptomyces zhihengii]